MKKSEFVQAVVLSNIYSFIKHARDMIEDDYVSKMIPEELKFYLETLSNDIYECCNAFVRFSRDFEKDKFDEKE